MWEEQIQGLSPFKQEVAWRPHRRTITACGMMTLIYCVVLMLGWTRLCASLQSPQGQGAEIKEEEAIETGHTTSSIETGDATNTAPDIAPQNAPCFLDDILATLRESLEQSGQPRNDSLDHFGVCTDNSLRFTQLANEESKNGLDVLYPAEVRLDEGEDGKTLTLSFDSLKSLPTMLNPVLLLPFGSHFRASDVHITFTSPALNPHTQTLCISEETKYILLTGKDGPLPQTWEISLQTNTPDKQQKNSVGGETGSNTGIFALLLLSTQRGTDTSDLSHNSFLCELRRFLVQCLTQDQEAPLLNLESLQSLPSLPLGLSSSESLLAGLINSTGLTILSFSQWSMLQAHHEQLALPPALVEELRQRLEQALTNIEEVLKDEEGGRAIERLKRLKRLSGFPLTQHTPGKLQYRAFLLFKALQSANRAFEVPRGQRDTRADRVPRTICGLKSLTVSLTKYLVAPSTATINNCQGSCTFPVVNGNNHVALLNFYIEQGNTKERAPCCVPVAYDELEVVVVNENGTYLTVRTNMVATACECR